jgi:hypothetical protein
MKIHKITKEKRQLRGHNWLSLLQTSNVNKQLKYVQPVTHILFICGVITSRKKLIKCKISNAVELLQNTTLEFQFFHILSIFHYITALNYKTRNNVNSLAPALLRFSRYHFLPSRRARSRPDNIEQSRRTVYSTEEIARR